MTPTDPRHGTYAGANQHWITRTPMCQPCADAAFKYAKRRKRDGDRLIPSYRATRRRDALYALGWSARHIAEAGGTTTAAIHQCGKRDTITPAAFAAVCQAFEKLSMKLPEPSGYVTRNKNNARRDGLVPPLGWLDIDDEHETPDLGAADTGADPMVVERILAGDWRLKATPEERYEVIRRYERSDNELERRTGWNIARDKRDMAAAARLEEAS